MKCRVSGKETVEVFNLGELLMSDFTPDGEKPRTGLGELKMRLCKESGLLQLETILPPEEMYGKYWYRSGINDTMKQKLKDVAVSCLDSIETKEGDVFLAISTSGNSKNILKGIQVAKKMDILVIGLTGIAGGQMADLCDVCLKMPSSSTPRIQECHILMGHLICSYIEQELFGSAAPLT